MGVRIALGAGRDTVVRMVLGQGIKLTAIGIALGVAGALGASRLMTSLLWETAPSDPLTHISVALILSSVALLATWLPARRAARIDPMEAFRDE